MDANQTRFHLLLGGHDWARCRVWLPALEAAGHALRDCWEASPPEDTPCDLRWDRGRNELTLRPKPFHFTASAGDRKPELGRAADHTTSDRRGAARDQFGNWYFISEDRREILAWSAGCRHTAAFWSCDGRQIVAPEKHGIFEPVASPPPPPPGALSGLTITEDHYLVAGTIGPEQRGGLLLFDLHSGGPPRHLCWPVGVKWEPFDMAPRRCGGVWILDRKNRRFWALDRHLRVMATQPWESPVGAGEGDVFHPLEGATTAPPPPRSFPEGLWLDLGSPVEAMDPVSIEALPDGTVLILGAAAGGGPSAIRRYKFDELLEQIVLDIPLTAGLEEGKPEYFRPAYDFAFLPAAKTAPPPPPCGCPETEPTETDSSRLEKLGDLFIVSSQGNQTIRFELRGAGEQIQWEAMLDFYPMCLFSGMGLVAGAGRVLYDSARRWVPLVEQERPLYVEEGVFVSPEFDAREPGCVWHRVMLDGCLPPETAVEISSRASDEKDELALAEWKAEPALYRRGTGSELPFVAPPTSRDEGTFEFLFQRAQGRYLQLKVLLSGNGRSTPRLRAMRVYYPRFSYSKHYLPAVYREDRDSASFLERFLANLEGTHTALEDRIAAVQMLFDWRSAPAETLAWLAGWFGIALDPAWDEPRQRLFLRHAMHFFQWRGTIPGLQMALHLAFDQCVCDALLNPPTPNCRCRACGGKGRALRRRTARADRFRVVERFRLRRLPPVAFGEPDDGPGPRLVVQGGRWTPQKGADDLRRRFEDWRTGKNWRPFDLGPGASAEETAARTAFARRELGFEPSDVVEDQQGWRDFLRRRYRSIQEARDVHAAPWSDFDAIAIPSDQPVNAKLLDDWREYLSSDEPMPYEVKRRLWQDFLARRYSSAGALNAKYRTRWQEFEWISYPTTLPANPWLLNDWYQFESLVLPTLESAHRFTVLLPFTGHTLPELEQRRQNLELARRLLELEKPAHTVFDVKFYWALFRVGEARLGLDTVLGLGGRDPGLLPKTLLGDTFLAESQLAATHPFDVTERQIVGRDRLN